MRILLTFVCFFLAFNLSGQEKKYVTVNKTLTLMGSRFDITVVALNEELGYISIDEAMAEIMRIEKMISSWDKTSETSKINRNAGIKPVKVSQELYKLIERSKQISEITDGAFDISYAPINRVWKFDGSMKAIPSVGEIKKSISKVDYQKIILDEKNRTIFLKEKGMQISFGAIGKGFAADKAKKLLISKQVKAGMINASGDITTWGAKVNGDKWLIGIANPLGTGKIFSWVPVIESSVATTDSSEKYVAFKEKKYGHVIDPRTGYPASGVYSVSIFAKSAELCDALATAIFVMGKEAGISLVNQLGGTEVVLIDDENNIHKSEGILLDVGK